MGHAGLSVGAPRVWPLVKKISRCRMGVPLGAYSWGQLPWQPPSGLVAVLFHEGQALTTRKEHTVLGQQQVQQGELDRLSQAQPVSVPAAAATGSDQPSPEDFRPSGKPLVGDASQMAMQFRPNYVRPDGSLGLSPVEHQRLHQVGKEPNNQA